MPPATMRIGIDGYNLALAQGTGVATYGFTLAETLAEGGHAPEGLFGVSAGADPVMRETLFFDRLGREPKPQGPALLLAYHPRLARRAVEVPLTARVDRRPLSHRWPPFRRLVTAPRLFALAHRHFATFRRFVPVTMPDPPEIMHWTYPVPLTLKGARNIYTLHDLVPLKLPYTTTTAKRNYRALVAQCIEQAARICTVSDASRNDILAEFGTDPSRVTTCWQAAPSGDDAPSSLEEDAAAIEATLGLAPQGYFLFFGAIEPKKNVGRLIEAHLSRDTATPLVIVGGKGWQSEGELTLLRPDPALGHDAALGARVIRLEHLPRLLLTRLIRCAKAVAFPSITEGFGLPVLEAMALGTPVLTSRGGALEEVAGDAALLVDPLEVRDIAAGLARLDADTALRARLAAAGPIRAERFSQARFLERLMQMYAQVLTQPPSC
jgi:glycosyltransferase involved in cell wall biosynthesis